MCFLVIQLQQQAGAQHPEETNEEAAGSPLPPLERMLFRETQIKELCSDLMWRKMVKY